MLDLQGKDFKSTILDMFKKLKENISKELKKAWECLTQQIVSVKR